MIKLTDEMKERINDAFTSGKPCVLATADKHGAPDINFRGSMGAWDDEHLFFWDRSLELSTTNIEENPNVVVLYMDRSVRIGWRFYGQATIFKDGPIRQKIMDRTLQAELDKDPERKGYGVLIRVDKVRPYSGGAALQER